MRCEVSLATGLPRLKGSDNCGLTVKEQRPSLIVRCHALQERQRIADPVRCCGGQLRRVKQRVYRDDLLEQRCHDT